MKPPRVFYFDFVRLRRIPAFRQFRVLFFHKLLWMTPVITLFFWSLAIPLVLWVLPDIPFSFLLALLPLFVLRSLIGAYQIRLFAEGQFRTLNATILFSRGLVRARVDRRQSRLGPRPDHRGDDRARSSFTSTSSISATAPRRSRRCCRWATGSARWPPNPARARRQDHRPGLDRLATEVRTRSR